MSMSRSSCILARWQFHRCTVRSRIFSKLSPQQSRSAVLTDKCEVKLFWMRWQLLMETLCRIQIFLNRLRCESRTFFIDAVTGDITPGFNYTSDQSFLEFTFSYALSLSLLIGHSKTWMQNMYNCKSTYNCTFTKYVIPRSFTNIVVKINSTIGPCYTTWKILDLNLFY